MKISDFLREDAVLVDLKGVKKQDVLAELLSALKASQSVKDDGKILESLLEREKLGSTGIGQGIAVPHTKTDQIEDLVGALGISRKGVQFDSLDGEPVYIVFLVLASSKATGIHLKALAKIARLLKDRVFRNTLKNCKSPAEALRVIREDEEKINTLA